VREKGQKSSKTAAVAQSQQSAEARKRVLLVDDHPMMRMGVTALINAEPDLTVCGEANTAEQALTIIPDCKPDIIVTDMTMPGRGGLEFIKDVAALHAELPVLVVSMHDEMLHAERAFRAGARGYLMKEAGGEKLLEAIRKVLRGQAYLSEKMAANAR
jgi:DNA-binding NarL/FixJ family response regulator